MLGARKSPKKSFEKAFSIAKKSLALDPSCAFPYVILARCYLIVRQYTKAIASCKEAIRFDPNDAFAYSNLAFILAFSGKLREAIEAIEKGLRLNPIPPIYVFSFQGLAYYHAGMYEEAVSALVSMIGRRRQPTSPGDT